MGAQIAGHLANAGISSLLFDLKKSDVENSKESLKKLKPAPLYLPKNTELVFLFANPNAPMPQAKRRKDGTKRSHGEWASKNNFKWYTSDTLPEEWRSDERLEKQLA